MTVRPPWTAVIGLLAVVVVQPGRHGSLLLTGLAEGPTSRLALFSITLAASGVVAILLFARTSMRLDLDNHGRAVLTHQGWVRRRVIPTAGLHEVRLVAGPARRAILIDDEGRLVTVIGAFSGFWRRDDVVALLEGAGVSVGHEHRLNRAADIEAAYPGSTAWIERRALRLYGLATVAAIGALFAMAWFLEF